MFYELKNKLRVSVLIYYLNLLMMNLMIQQIQFKKDHLKDHVKRQRKPQILVNIMIQVVMKKKMMKLINI